MNSKYTVGSSQSAVHSRQFTVGSLQLAVFSLLAIIRKLEGMPALPARQASPEA